MNEFLEKAYKVAIDTILGILILFLIVLLILFIYRIFEFLQYMNPIYILSIGVFYLAYRIGKYIRRIE
jgi:hypothetical protein